MQIDRVPSDLILLALLLLFVWQYRSIKAPRRVRLSIQGKVWPGTVLLLSSRLNQRVGLLNTPSLHLGDGVLLKGVRSIHTVGMSFGLDLIFLDDRMQILAWQEAVEPGQALIKGPKGTTSIIELAAGSIAHCGMPLEIHAVIVIEG